MGELPGGVLCTGREKLEPPRKGRFFFGKKCGSDSAERGMGSYAAGFPRGVSCRDLAALRGGFLSPPVAVTNSARRSCPRPAFMLRIDANRFPGPRLRIHPRGDNRSMVNKLEADSSAAAKRIVNLAHTRAPIDNVIEATIQEPIGLEARTTPLAIAVFLQDVDAGRRGTRNIAALYKLRQAQASSGRRRLARLDCRTQATRALSGSGATLGDHPGGASNFAGLNGRERCPARFVASCPTDSPAMPNRQRSSSPPVLL
jgi:hypothetical protein